VTVADLAANRLLGDPPRVAWDRAVASLQARAGTLHGIGLATLDRIEAFILYRPAAPGAAGPPSTPWTGHVTPSGRGAPAEALLRLVAMVLERTGPPLHLPSLSETEVPAEWLRDRGFRTVARRRRYLATARPA